MLLSLIFSFFVFAAETEKKIFDITLDRPGKANRVVSVLLHKRPGYGVNAYPDEDISDLSKDEWEIVERKALDSFYEYEAENIRATKSKVIGAKASAKIAK